MKIALVSPFDFSYFGGVQNQVRQFADYAREHGNTVHIYAPTSTKESIDGLVSVGMAVPILMPGGGTVTRISLMPWNSGYRAMRQRFAEGYYEIIHVHAPEIPMLGLTALRFAQRAPPHTRLITTSHSNRSTGLPTKAYARMAKHFSDRLGLAAAIDVRIAVSPAAKASIEQTIPGEYRIIPNGIDTERFSPAVTPIDKYNDSKLNILFVGRLGNHERRKGLEYLVAAFNSIHWQHPNTRIIIIGAGKPDSHTIELIRAGGSTDIIFEGAVPLSGLPRYYARAHIGVAPATHGESFGLVPAEFMSSGIPVIATDIPGYDNVIGDAGILVPPKDSSALANGLEYLINNPEERRRLAIEGRQRVVDNFEKNKVYAQILQAYEEALQGKPAGLQAVRE